MFPLRCRSYYSLLRAVCSPAALCRQAKEYGYSGLALTDRDNLYGLWPFLAACRRENLRPVVGAEVSDPAQPQTILACLVRDDTGYRNLCQLLTARHRPDFSFIDTVGRYGEGLLILGRDSAILARLRADNLKVAADLGPRPTASASQLRKWAREAGVVAVATPDSCLTLENPEIYRLLRAIANNTSLSRLQEHESLDPIERLAASESYESAFAIWPEVLDATEELAETCTFSGPKFGTVMPPWRGEGQPAIRLHQAAYSGARRRYGDDLGEPVVERLEHELQVIESMGFSSYFLVVRDIVHRPGTKGSPRRICGRGSGAASLVAYCLEITNVCPISHNLYFERFLNPGRTDPPDIDIDFAWDERADVIAETLADFPGQSAMVCNHIVFQPRMAIRETAKAFGLPGYEISRLTKRLPWLYEVDGEDLAGQLASLPTLRDQDFAEPWPEILRLAAQIIGIPRYLSVHPGGVVITPGPISEYVPIEMAAKGVPIIQWEKDGTEEAGLVKIDLLGNRSLGVIRDCLAALKTKQNAIDEQLWNPETDGATNAAVAAGQTMGCFYIESPAMRLLQQKAASGEFEQLVIQSSIIRPAANEFVREYVRRLHGGSWQPLHPTVGDVLDETFGLMVYQEDVSRVAVAMAGFSHAEADGLRKIMSKKDKELRLRDYREKFYTGCLSRGIATADVDRVWKMMMSFDGYSFCKPHSASYARVSFQAAYLKKHHPAEFMAAVISNQGGYYSTFAYVSEAKRMGVAILPPDVNRSTRSWQGENKQIRVGLMAVRGLSDGLLQRMLETRSHQNFSDCLDFFCRILPEEDEARMLIHAGALDALEPEKNRTELLWQWAAFQRARELAAGARLFPVHLPDPPPLPPPDERIRQLREMEALGFLCQGHPLLGIARRPKHCILIADLAKYRGRRISCIGWLLTGKLVSTRSGEVMEFLTFEDETGIMETTFFPATYRRSAHLLHTGGVYLLSGLVDEDYGAVTLTVEHVQAIKNPA